MEQKRVSLFSATLEAIQNKVKFGCTRIQLNMLLFKCSRFTVQTQKRVRTSTTCSSTNISKRECYAFLFGVASSLQKQTYCSIANGRVSSSPPARRANPQPRVARAHDSSLSPFIQVRLHNTRYFYVPKTRPSNNCVLSHISSRIHGPQSDWLFVRDRVIGGYSFAAFFVVSITAQRSAFSRLPRVQCTKKWRQLCHTGCIEGGPNFINY